MYVYFFLVEKNLVGNYDNVMIVDGLFVKIFVVNDLKSLKLYMMKLEKGWYEIVVFFVL